MYCLFSVTAFKFSFCSWTRREQLWEHVCWKKCSLAVGQHWHVTKGLSLGGGFVDKAFLDLPLFFAASILLLTSAKVGTVRCSSPSALVAFILWDSLDQVHFAKLLTHNGSVTAAWQCICIHSGQPLLFSALKVKVPCRPLEFNDVKQERLPSPSEYIYFPCGFNRQLSLSAVLYHWIDIK